MNLPPIFIQDLQSMPKLSRACSTRMRISVQRAGSIVYKTSPLVGRQCSGQRSRSRWSIQETLFIFSGLRRQSCQKIDGSSGLGGTQERGRQLIEPSLTSFEASDSAQMQREYVMMEEPKQKQCLLSLYSLMVFELGKMRATMQFRRRDLQCTPSLFLAQQLKLRKSELKRRNMVSFESQVRRRCILVMYSQKAYMFSSLLGPQIVITRHTSSMKWSLNTRPNQRSTLSPRTIRFIIPHAESCIFAANLVKWDCSFSSCRITLSRQMQCIKSTRQKLFCTTVIRFIIRWSNLDFYLIPLRNYSSYRMQKWMSSRLSYISSMYALLVRSISCRLTLERRSTLARLRAEKSGKRLLGIWVY